jgi:hypothetical protein
LFGFRARNLEGFEVLFFEKWGADETDSATTGDPEDEV